MISLKKFLLLILFILISVYFSFFLFIQDNLSIQNIKDLYQILEERKDGKNIEFFLIFFFLYFFVSAFALPIAGVFSILIGALFGFYMGVFLVSFSSSFGSVASFLISRYIFRDFFQNRYKQKIQYINKKIKEDGLLFLFMMRMIPIIPFFLVNLLFGLTKVKVKDFYIVSQLGMLAVTCLYVNAGNQISEIETLKQLANINIIIAFCLIGIFPFVIKKIYYNIGKHNKLN
tara:strand:+ start:257 stop:949 length:693 start_codon:yes stop_codon:yes gene_type:complete